MKAFASPARSSTYSMLARRAMLTTASV